MKREATCPHCQHKQHVEIDVRRPYIPALTCCDAEQGGCDEWYVYSATISVAVSARKIEGEAEA